MLKLLLFGVLWMSVSSIEEKGPYNVVLRQISGCEKTGFIRPKINIQDETKFPHVGSLILEKPIEDIDKIEIIMAAWIDGDWKENYYHKIIENPYTMIKTYFKDYYFKNVKNDTSKIPVGSYNMEEFIEYLPEAVPVFTYHSFKIDVNIEKNETENGCIKFFLDMTQRGLTP